MFETTRRTCSMLGAAAGSTLCAGLAVMAGIIPQHGATSTNVQAAAVAPLETVVPAVSDVTPTTDLEVEAAPVEAPTTTEPPTTLSEVTTTAPPVTAAPPPPLVEDIREPEVPPPATPAPTPEPTPSQAVPRREPTSAEVGQALEGLKLYVQTPFPIGPSQVAEAGDKVCTALDEGKSVEEVKAEGMALVKKVPFTTVKPGADDYVVRTTVALYCPDHASKLS